MFVDVLHVGCEIYHRRGRVDYWLALHSLTLPQHISPPPHTGNYCKWEAMYSLQCSRETTKPLIQFVVYWLLNIGYTIPTKRFSTRLGVLE